MGDARALLLAGACLLLSLAGYMVGLQRCAIAFLGAAVAFTWCIGYGILFPDPVEDGEDVTVTVRVCDLPQTTRYGYSVAVELEGQDTILYGGSAIAGFLPGDIVTCRAQVEKTSLTNAGDETLFNRSRGIRYCLYSEGEYVVEHGSVRRTEQIRQYLRQKIDALYVGETKGFLQAILIGDRSNLSPLVEEVFSTAGISHTVAVSGMHLSMLLAMVVLVCGGNPRITAWIGIPTVIAFALMTGASASVCRAAVMQIILLCAPLAHREHDTPTALGVAAVLLLLINPWAVADVSFQLSFAAVLGLALLASPIQNAILSLRPYPGRFLRFLAQGVSATLGATVMTLPLTVFYFGRVSLAALPVNLLTLWAVTAVFTLGLLSCVIGGMGTLLAGVVDVLTDYILWISHKAAAIPYAAAYPQNLPLLIWGIAAYILSVVLILVRKKNIRLWLMTALTASFMVCLLCGNASLVGKEMTFTAADVGQGQCLLLNCGGFSAMIDCGGSYDTDAGTAAISVLHSGGVTMLDAVVVTHYDEDHVNGIPFVLDRISVKRLFLPDYPSDLRQELERIAAEKGTEVIVVSTGAEVGFENGFLKIMAAKDCKDENDASLCVLAKAAEYDILITGDRTEEGEKELLSRWDIPQVDLLVAGHHGSKYATSQFLLEQVTPQTVVISVEQGNRFGHPAPEMLERIAAVGAEVLRTDLQGTVTVVPKK